MSALRVRILAVGSELTRGQSQDAHGPWLARALSQAGLQVLGLAAAPDSAEALERALRSALEDCELLIVTGGLGPTADDLTREALARVLGLALVEDLTLWAEIQARFKARGKDAPPNNRVQAQLLKGAVALPNPHGTAPGQRVDLSGKTLFCLPGPPSELRPMAEAHLFPWAAKAAGNAHASRSLMVHGLAESTVDQVLRPLLQGLPPEAYAILAHGTHVQVIVSAVRPTEAEAQAEAAALADKMAAPLGPHVYSLSGESLEAVLGRMLVEAQARVAVAESCTGGRVAARLTAVPGSSAYFLGGMLTYADELKQKLLGVPPFVLKKAGAVSKDTALAMAVGLARAVECDFALAITGLAGPDGGSDEKPVGLVHLALAMPEGVWHQELRLGPGERSMIQARAAQCALWLLYCALAELDAADFTGDRASQPVPWRD